MQGILRVLAVATVGVAIAQRINQGLSVPRSQPVHPGSVWTLRCPNVSHALHGRDDRLAAAWSLNGRIWLKIDNGVPTISNSVTDIHRQPDGRGGERLTVTLNAGRYRFLHDVHAGDLRMVIDAVNDHDEGTWQCHVDLHGRNGVEQWVTHATLQLTTSSSGDAGGSAFYYSKPRKNQGQHVYIDRLASSSRHNNNNYGSGRRRQQNNARNGDVGADVTFDRAAANERDSRGGRSGSLSGGYGRNTAAASTVKGQARLWILLVGGCWCSLLHWSGKLSAI